LDASTIGHVGDDTMDSESEGQAPYRADADAGVNFQVVVGDHNLVVRAEGGSVVTARTGEPPAVQRRDPPDTGPLRPRPLGRERELTAIAQALDEGLAVQVHGGDGSGRSTVLGHLTQLRGGDRDVVFLSARGVAIDDLLQALFDACFDSSGSDGYRPDSSRMRELMGSVRALLLVDDFDGDAADLKALLDAAPAGGVAVVSRERALWPDGFALELSELDKAAGMALLARELGRNVESHEVADATKLWRAAGGSPLALVQAAAAVREGAGTLAEFRDPQQVAQALAGNLTEPQQQVLGVLYLIGTVPAPAAFLAALIGAPYEAAIERLVAAGLVTGRQPRIAGRLAERVAALAATPVAPARLAETITAWLAAGLDRRLIGESAPMILQVLRATMATGDYHTAVRLARVASPKLAMSLHLGAWGILLELGLSAARAANAADDEAYLAHEAAARRQVLGEPAPEAPEVTALVLTAPVGSMPVLSMPVLDTPTVGMQTMEADTPPAPTAGPPTAPARGNIRKAFAKPAVWVAVIVAALAATIAVTAFDTGDRPRAAPALGSTMAPTTSTPPPSTAAETSTTISAEPTTPVTTSLPVVTGTSISATAATATASATGPTSAPRSASTTTNPPPDCPPSIGALGFATVTVGTSKSLTYNFRSPLCHPHGLNTGSMSIRGANAAAFSFALVSCPPITTSDATARCTITVTFRPPAPGDFTAFIYIPEAGPAAEQRSYATISLSGHADMTAYAYNTATPN